MGSSTENSAFGPTRNPLDTSRVPGGSSGGSTAAVAAGFVPLALGSDTGGSIRQPAALCGVVGMKPTFGAVSRFGLVAFASSLDQIGPIATTVADAGRLYEAIAGHDPLDTTSFDEPVALVSASLDDGVEGLRIGVLTELCGGGVEGIAADVQARTDQAVSALEAAGAIMTPISVPSATLGLSAYHLIAPAEASSNLARYDGVRYGLRTEGATTAEMNINTRTNGFGTEVKRRIMLGTYALSAGYYDAFLRQGLAGPHPDASGLCRRLRAGRPVDLANGPDYCFRARCQDRRSPDDVYERCVHDSFQPGGSPGDLGAVWHRRRRAACGGAVAGTGAVGGHSVPSRRGARGGRAMSDDSRGRGRGPDLPRAERSREAADKQSANSQRDSEYETVIGLEVHVELATATKLFCGCANRFGDDPNTNICPTCLGLPGSLPVVNSTAVEYAMRLGRALGCSVERSVFARKNYFYPDMPKDYQVSQYDQPTNVNGSLELPDGSVVGIERAHIEEDTGKSTHMGGGGRIHDAEYSLVDYNRAGVPLVEVVSRPDIRSADQAKTYVAELRGILLAIGVSDARMEEGSIRVDANVSVRPAGSDELRTRCEIKNINSLRVVRPGDRLRSPAPHRSVVERL